MAGSAQEPSETGHAETKPVSVKDREIRSRHALPNFRSGAHCGRVFSRSPYARPQVDVATGWTSLTKAARSGVQARAGWWRSFSSPELNRLIDRGLTGNLNLQAAVARIAQARGHCGNRRGAALACPLAGRHAGPEYGCQEQPNPPVARTGDLRDRFLGQEPGRRGVGSGAARCSAFDADTVAMTLSASLADTYFQNPVIAGTDCPRSQHRRRCPPCPQPDRDPTEPGYGNRPAVAQQRATVATFEAAVPALQQQMDLAIHALAALTGQIPEGFAVTADEHGPLSRPDILPDLPAALLARRRTSARPRHGLSRPISISALHTCGFLSQYLPDRFGWCQVEDFAALFPRDRPGRFRADLLQPLFQRGQLEGQLQVSRGRQIELVAAYRQAVLTAFQDVEDALSTLNQVRAQAAIETMAQAAARKAADLAQLLYSLGSADYLSVLTTEPSLYTAQDTLLQLKLLNCRDCRSLQSSGRRL